ncbi:hypothetical protein D9M72_579030 [compost metagenome]
MRFLAICQIRSAASRMTMPASTPRKMRLTKSSCTIIVALTRKMSVSQPAAKAMITNLAPRSISTLRITRISSFAVVSSIVCAKALVKRRSGGRPMT